MKRKKVYLFACIEKNIGDDLFVFTLCQRYPEIDFIISSSAEYLSENNINNLEYNDLMKKWLRYANDESRFVLKRAITNIREQTIRKKLGKKDSVYIVGNAFKNMNYKGFYQLKWLERRIALSDRFYLLSTNYGPTNDERWKNDCEKVYEQMTDICFRDTESYELFKHLKNVRYAPDAILSLSVNKKENKIKPYIVISTIDCSMHERGKVLNNAALKYENKMVDLINHFNEDGVEVVLLNSNTTQDNPASQRILNNCIHKERVSVFNYNGNFKEVFEIYNSAKAVIATRLHTIILSWLYDLPVIPIVYDIKVKNLLDSYKFDYLTKDITNLDNLDYLTVTEAIDSYSFKLSNDIVAGANKQFEKLDEHLK